MSELFDKQCLFSRMVAKLLTFAHDAGYEVTLGDAYRDPRVFGGAGIALGYGNKNSAHKKRLAIDINLFRDGRYLSKSEDHKPLGDFWKSLNGDARWGGDFGGSEKDGNHYSITHDGVS